MPRLFAAIALLVSTLTPVFAQEGPAGVATDFVERREIAETLPVFAEVVARRESTLATRVAGVVTNVTVQVGDRVAAGDVLASLDTEVLSIDLRAAEAAATEARAGIEVARAGLLLAERGFARVDGLRNTNAFSQGQFEDREGELARARGELARAEAQLLNAEAALARAEYEYARAVIDAPFDAVVLDVAVDPGEYIQLGAPVAQLLDIAELEVEANVPAQYVANLEPGQVVTGQGGSGGTVDLVVRAVLPIEATATRTRPVRFEAALDVMAGPVAVGQSVTVNIPVTQSRAALLVPKDAVTRAQGAWQVFVHREGKAMPQPVEIGASFGTDFEVLSGLAPGDEVVVRGNERLRPMQDIAPQPVRQPPEQVQEGAARAPDGPRMIEKARAATNPPAPQVVR